MLFGGPRQNRFPSVLLQPLGHLSVSLERRQRVITRRGLTGHRGRGEQPRKAISELRKALGDESHAPRFIATIPGATLRPDSRSFSATRSDRSPLRRILAGVLEYSGSRARAIPERTWFGRPIGSILSLNGPSDDPRDDSLSIPRPSRQPRRVRLSSGPLRSRDGSGRRPAGVCRGAGGARHFSDTTRSDTKSTSSRTEPTGRG